MYAVYCRACLSVNPCIECVRVRFWRVYLSVVRVCPSVPCLRCVYHLYTCSPVTNVTNVCVCLSLRVCICRACLSLARVYLSVRVSVVCVWMSVSRVCLCRAYLSVGLCERPVFVHASVVFHCRVSRVKLSRVYVCVCV